MYGIAIGLLAFSFVMIDEGPGFLLFFVPGALISMDLLAHRLFSRTRVRLMELLVTILVLGNLVGLIVANYPNHHYPRRPDVFGIAVAVLGAAIWVIGGFSNGLIIANRLKMENTADRLWLMFVFLAYPPAMLGLIVTPVVISASGNGASRIIAGTLLVLFLLLSVHAYTWQRRVKALAAS